MGYQGYEFSPEQPRVDEDCFIHVGVNTHELASQGTARAKIEYTNTDGETVRAERDVVLNEGSDGRPQVRIIGTALPIPVFKELQNRVYTDLESGSKNTDHADSQHNRFLKKEEITDALNILEDVQSNGYFRLGQLDAHKLSLALRDGDFRAMVLTDPRYDEEYLDKLSTDLYHQTMKEAS